MSKHTDIHKTAVDDGEATDEQHAPELPVMDGADADEGDTPPIAKEFIRRAIQMLEEDESQELIKLTRERIREPIEPPWPLEQFFNGDIDLESELAMRFSSTPVMSTIKIRKLGANAGRSVATLTTQDGAAQVIFDADAESRALQASFTLGSMLSLRFVLRDLVDRTRWLSLMRRDGGGLAFLWGSRRWEKDYIICIARKYYTIFYAFSPNGLEAAARLTPEITGKLLNWLEKAWGAEEEIKRDNKPDMLTW
ncbi:MAG: hypothetical protein EA396_04185 [Anaerolineaceae bacterium]|nr:MAG: hypothetical protein EA396_04185 [Anaerolineaceae bacterium]